MSSTDSDREAGHQQGTSQPGARLEDEIDPATYPEYSPAPEAKRRQSSMRRMSSVNFLDNQEHSHFLAEDYAVKGSSFPYIKTSITALGLVLGLVLCFTTIQDNKGINQTLAIAVWMATLWLTEIIPLVVTAFLPLILFPAFGILSSADVASQYVNNTIFLLISGFMMALTLERWNLHRRFSLKVLTWCGTRPQILLLGMMGATFFLSMFISNTATTLMMVPNAISVCATLETSTSATYRKESKKFTIALMLGIAYAANVGGMSSLIGTVPNLVFQRQLELLFPDAPEFSFARWIAFGLPVGLVLFVIIWVYLCLVYLRNFKDADSRIDSSLFRDQYTALGAWPREQVAVCVLFFLLCFLWLFRSDLDFGAFTINGWSNIFPEPSYISDATTGMFIAFILFVSPARSVMLVEEEDKKHDEVGDTKPEDAEVEDKVANDTTLLDWGTANQMPYDVVFLLGGGFALAKGFVESGLSAFLGEQLASLDISLVGLVFLMLTLIIWLTELTSNTSTSNIMVPIAASIAVASQASPYTFMIPATMACSCAFVLPIATPPNMVVFSTGRLPMREMNKAGILLNVIGSLVLLGAAFSIIPAVLGVDASEFPSWATTPAF